MSRYGYLEVCQSSLEFEVTRVDCIIFLELSEEFPGTQKRVRISQRRRANVLFPAKKGLLNKDRICFKGGGGGGGGVGDVGAIFFLIEYRHLSRRGLTCNAGNKIS